MEGVNDARPDFQKTVKKASCWFDRFKTDMGLMTALAHKSLV
jgi:hypothetical protein